MGLATWQATADDNTAAVDALLVLLLGVAPMCLPCSVMPHVDHCGGSRR